MKFVINADTDEIFGAPLLRIDAMEIINTVAVAVRHGVAAAALCDATHPRPKPYRSANEVLVTIALADEPQVGHP